ncbi:hypothetical protein [Sulfitobacter pacificus]|uniref:hypothetical protein n=1 Tax=Sulfitobacter pacificus TaxID=1499314 RepID=UPI0024E13849|nr:hypothetical protein [Sulfitobacter pacificus]
MSKPTAVIRRIAKYWQKWALSGHLTLSIRSTSPLMGSEGSCADIAPFFEFEYPSG